MRFSSFRIAFIGTLLLLWVPETSAQKRVFARVAPNAGSINGDADVFDPATGIFTPVAGKMNKSRESHVAITLYTGKILIAGGYNDGYLNTAELFDPETGTYSADDDMGKMSAARVGAASTWLGQRCRQRRALFNRN